MLSFGGKVALKKQSEVVRTTEYDFLIKIIIIGDSGVGKSCLLLRYADSTFFSESYISTIGVDFKIKTVDIDGKRVKVQLWDTTGQERFRTITSSYYRGAHAVFMVYDITDRSSFNNIQKWRQEIERYACENVSKIIVGNKCDLEDRREVSEEELKALSESTNIPAMETSAKGAVNVEESFTTVIRHVLNRLGDSATGLSKLPVVPKPVAAAPSPSSGGFMSSVMGLFGKKPSPNTTTTTTTSTSSTPAASSGYESSEEEFSDEELEQNMNSLVTMEEKAKREREKEKDSKKKKKEKAAPSAPKAASKHTKTDVNIFRLDLSKVSDESPVMTGDPVFCLKCASVLNHLSKITPNMTKEDLKSKNQSLFSGPQPPAFSGVKDLFAPPEENAAPITVDKQTYDDLPSEVSVWMCEFCDYGNVVELVDEELPKAETVDFVIEPAPLGAVEEQNIVFCVDISGSMVVTTEINQRDLKLKGATSLDELMRQHGGQGDQRLPNERRGVTYVSRLQCVQAAIEHHITSIANSKPKNKIGLVTFNDEVQILGDGTQEPVTVAGDKLDSWAALKELGESYSISKSVEQADKDLIKKLWSLQENGCTSLGPALLLSILIAGSKPGGKVILCTDGVANSGLGSMEDKATEFTPFYTECAEAAKVKGVTVSIISITSDDCSLENLSIVTEQTGGEVERVDPQNIANNFQSILTNPIIATGCMANIFLHKGLMFKNEVDDELDENRNFLIKDLGNITAESECTFSYGFRPKSQVDVSEVTEIPFQVQLVYSRLNGMKCVRISTAKISVTEDRAEAERQADIKVIGTHAVQKAAKYAKEGAYEKAQLETRAAARFMDRNYNEEVESIKSVWASNVESMDAELRTELQREKKEGTEASYKSRQEVRKNKDSASVAISKAKKSNQNSLFNK